LVGSATIGTDTVVVVEGPRTTGGISHTRDEDDTGRTDTVSHRTSEANLQPRQIDTLVPALV